MGKFLLGSLGIIFAILLVYLLIQKNYRIIEEPEITTQKNNTEKLSSPDKISEKIKFKNPPDIRPLNPSIVPKAKEKMSIHEHIEDLRAVITKQWDEVRECESEFDQMFGKYIERINGPELYTLTEEELLDISEKIETFSTITPSSSLMIEMLGRDINKNIDPDLIYNTVGFIKYCREYEQDRLFALLTSKAIPNKEIAAKAALTLLERHSNMLTYDGHYQILLLELNRLAIFLGNNNYIEEIKAIQKKFDANHEKESVEYSKCPNDIRYCFPAQKMMLNLSKETQKDLKKIIKKFQDDLP